MPAGYTTGRAVWLRGCFAPSTPFTLPATLSPHVTDEVLGAQWGHKTCQGCLPATVSLPGPARSALSLQGHTHRPGHWAVKLYPKRVLPGHASPSWLALGLIRERRHRATVCVPGFPVGAPRDVGPGTAREPLWTRSGWWEEQEPACHVSLAPALPPRDPRTTPQPPGNLASG